MTKSTCRHCGAEIGKWTDPWGGHPEWMHAPDDGPDAYSYCRCKCAECKPLSVKPAAYACCDGQEAEPVEEGLSATESLADAGVFDLERELKGTA
jgi:hypothetical protein